MSARRRRRGPPRCQHCNAPVKFFKNPSTNTWRPFDPRPLHPTQHAAGPVWVIENNVWAWPHRDLVEDLMVRMHCGRGEADEHADAMPRHVAHNCPNRPQEGP